MYPRSSGNSSRMHARVEKILLEDAALVRLLATESSHLVRETGDLLRIFFPVLTYLLKNRKKNLRGKDIPIGQQKWDYLNNSGSLYAYRTKFSVPGYWKIPYLKARANGILKIYLTVDTYNDSEPPSGTRMGGTASFRDEPSLKINFSYNPEKVGPESLGVVHRRLKAVLAHELEHFADERVTDYFKQRDQASSTGKWAQDLSKRFSYLSDPLEVRASISEFLRVAKARGIPFEDVLNRALAYEKKLKPEERAELERLYREEYARRGFGNRPRSSRVRPGKEPYPAPVI
jgi:hypothetical protein